LTIFYDRHTAAQEDSMTELQSDPHIHPGEQTGRAAASGLKTAARRGSPARKMATVFTAALLAVSLAACGWDKSDPLFGSKDSDGSTSTPQQSGAPTATGNVATDGLNWINYRRGQIGVAAVARNALIDAAAQNHSEYQAANQVISHEEVSGKTGYTSATLGGRLQSAGYGLVAPYAYGEVIAASSDNTGFTLSEKLLTAIYHRFVMVEPVFKEAGAGSATSTVGTTYFTADFAAVNGYAMGLTAGNIVTYPFADQTGVVPNFFSDTEEPDPFPDEGVDEIGYPISVHTNISGVLTVQTFTVRPRDGSNLETRLLIHDTDANTPASAAAILPLSPLRAATVYDVSFTGSADGVAVTRNWSFTTQ
jgi:uncharacterized protein YkwD